MTLEVCANSIESALAAWHGGAHRIELCSNLERGGLTPGPGTIAEACRRLDIPVMVLLRPRAGHFHYTAAEQEVMLASAKFCRQAGAAGLVVGALTADGMPDRPFLEKICALAEGMDLTFHRAFDLCRDPGRALEQLRQLGIRRVLTAGGAATAAEGADQIRRWQALAGSAVELMAGGGLTPDNLEEVWRRTGVHAFHLSAKTWIAADAAPALGPADASGWYQTSEAVVRRARAVIDRLRGESA
ncbi:MAG: copper homeostasis protein CutC [Alphaproteobacteria bacterium]|nr:MAG: copper homeostasis protein CutC [Alphaproteobacteria bacterium]